MGAASAADRDHKPYESKRNPRTQQVQESPMSCEITPLREKVSCSGT